MICAISLFALQTHFLAIFIVCKFAFCFYS